MDPPHEHRKRRDSPRDSRLCQGVTLPENLLPLWEKLPSPVIITTHAIGPTEAGPKNFPHVKCVLSPCVLLWIAETSLLRGSTAFVTHRPFVDMVVKQSRGKLSAKNRSAASLQPNRINANKFLPLPTRTHHHAHCTSPRGYCGQGAIHGTDNWLAETWPPFAGSRIEG
jgi:hypothetical protein